MKSESADSSSQAHDQDSSAESHAKNLNGSSPPKASDAEPTAIAPGKLAATVEESPAAGVSSNSRTSDLPQPTRPTTDPPGIFGISTFSRISSGLGLQFTSKAPSQNATSQGNVASPRAGVIESLTKGIVDSSRGAVKAMQVRARHAVSQNKRRYQEGGFDLDLSYITENIIAMGFPAGDLSSGILGFFEGFYRNHMEEVISFLETHHKGKYKVYNLCAERLYDASKFEGKVASFPFDDHNCPPLPLITSFCRSAYSWLKEDIENVVVVHCKAGMGRTGVMICSLLIFLKFFPTAGESIDSFNQKRCVDGKALVLPSQIRYVKYFDRVLTHFNGENQPGRRCMLRGFRLHKCPYWIRPAITISNHSGVLFSTKKHPKTKDLMPEDFWISAPKKGILVFALPGEPGLTELVGDFKIHFHERQGDFYCWLNTTLTENRKTLDASDLDGFDKRKLPSPGFQVEVVMIDYDGTSSTKSTGNSSRKESGDTPKGSDYASKSSSGVTGNSNPKRASENEDDVFSDSDSEETDASKSRQQTTTPSGDSSNITAGQLTHGTEQMSLNNRQPSKEQTTQKPNSALEMRNVDSVGASNIKAIAADASVFSFGDEEEDYESD
ncbi:phosphatidylinositol 3,4,5-trisphosphate 3-phosphatase and protein-tyrosine-phosphatase PTEN2A-like [Euphorbia lathyris]|uniref:phosphatidylinositol 3,4,5-trisphosphate 3-phosphatase and protein-tyrosine-phosphatase PTEN2A-like n=1 Tax=Euphorbia lathyris TaxID=212925 RepID=UPI003313997B